MSIYDRFAREQAGLPVSRTPVTPQLPATYQPSQPPQVPDPTRAAVPMEGKDGFDAAFAAGDRAGGARTQALMAAPHCPECGSENYLPAKQSAAQCFACGYNGGRFTHILG